MKKIFEATKIIRLSLEEPIGPLEVEERYRQVLLIVRSEGSVMAEIYLPALSVLPAEVVRRAIAAAVAEPAWQERVRSTVLRAVRGQAEPARLPSPTVSLIVCTRDRSDQLRSCLESLVALRTPPTEILVVDNCPSDDRTELLCGEFPVRYVREPLPGQARARNRGILESTGELIAFTDDDCVVDAGWLDRLAHTFADTLVMAASGFIGPLELENRAQWLFEMHGGFAKYFDRRVFDRGLNPVSGAGLIGAGANMIFRRSVFHEVGLFCEALGPGTPACSGDDTYQAYKILAAGYRIDFDSSRVVWHRHRSEEAALRRILFDYTVSSFVVTLRCLLKHREPAVVRVWWWWLGHVTGELWRSLGGSDWRMPSRIPLAEARGMLIGPWRALRTHLSRRRIPPLELVASEPPLAPPRVVVEAEHAPLSLVIPSRNRRDQLAELLEALARQIYPADRLETVVVLDGSEDDSAELVRTLPVPYELQLVEQENAGAAASRNHGARVASHPVAVFLDDDIVPEPGFLAAHARAHGRAPEQHLALGYAPPRITGPGLWGQHLRGWWEDHYRQQSEQAHQWTFIDFGAGNFSIPRELFLAFGGFDEDFKRQREDWELGFRLLERGVGFSFYRDAMAWHHLDARFETALRHQRRHAQDDVLLAGKHPALKTQLPLAHLARERPAGDERLASYGLRHARTLERLRLRRRWHKLAWRLLGNAYILGVEDALPSSKAVSAFLASIWDDAVDTVPLWLDQPGPLQLPAAAGAIELAVGYGHTRIGRVVPVEPAGHWDWEIVAGNVVGRLSEPLRQAFLVEELAAPLVEEAESSVGRGAPHGR